MNASCSPEAVRCFVRGWISSHSKKASGNGDLDGAANFVATGIIDSVAFVRLLMDAESEFGIELDFSELDPSEFLSIDGFTASVLQCVEEGS